MHVPVYLCATDVRDRQTFDDFVVEHWHSMSSFVIPKKMRHIEVEHVMNASELRLKTQV